MFYGLLSILVLPTCKEEAGIAIDTTYNMIKTSLHEGNANFSLCHGLAGNAELLVYARTVLNEEWGHKSQLALDVCDGWHFRILQKRRRVGLWSKSRRKSESDARFGRNRLFLFAAL